MPDRQDAIIGAVRARAFTIPTDQAEADGTIAWRATTLVLVEAEAGGMTGLGYTYADKAAAVLVTGTLAEVVRGLDALDVPRAFEAMRRAVRNLGRDGIAATAISAVDTALWDLKAKLLGLPLALLLGRRRETVAVYGSGGFTSYDDETLVRQLRHWVEGEGCQAVKMKIGTHPEDDPRRVCVAKRAIGDVSLYVDANGAYSVKQAVGLGRRFAAEVDVGWFEEPVSSDDLTGLRQVRDAVPMEVAAGEYVYDPDALRSMLEAGAVDVQQADASRCGGITGFMQAGALCEAHHRDLSGHCAPALHLHVACAAPRLRNLEWFHDHARIERMVFDGAPVPRDGEIAPDLTRPGLGLEFRRADAERFAA